MRTGKAAGRGPTCWTSKWSGSRACCTTSGNGIGPFSRLRWRSRPWWQRFEVRWIEDGCGRDVESVFSRGSIWDPNSTFAGAQIIRRKKKDSQPPLCGLVSSLIRQRQIVEVQDSHIFVYKPLYSSKPRPGLSERRLVANRSFLPKATCESNVLHMLRAPADRSITFSQIPNVFCSLFRAWGMGQRSFSLDRHV